MTVNFFTNGISETYATVWIYQAFDIVPDSPAIVRKRRGCQIHSLTLAAPLRNY
jgi:hypothetical protein